MCSPLLNDGVDFANIETPSGRHISRHDWCDVSAHLVVFVVHRRGVIAEPAPRVGPSSMRETFAVSAEKYSTVKVSRVRTRGITRVTARHQPRARCRLRANAASPTT